MDVSTAPRKDKIRMDANEMDAGGGTEADVVFMYYARVAETDEDIVTTTQGHLPCVSSNVYGCLPHATSARRNDTRRSMTHHRTQLPAQLVANVVTSEPLFKQLSAEVTSRLSFAGSAAQQCLSANCSTTAFERSRLLAQRTTIVYESTAQRAFHIQKWMVQHLAPKALDAGTSTAYAGRAGRRIACVGANDESSDDRSFAHHSSLAAVEAPVRATDSLLATTPTGTLTPCICCCVRR
jgi:hypothetical protein